MNETAPLTAREAAAPDALEEVRARAEAAEERLAGGLRLLLGGDR